VILKFSIQSHESFSSNSYPEYYHTDDTFSVDHTILFGLLVDKLTQISNLKNYFLTLIFATKTFYNLK